MTQVDEALAKCPDVFERVYAACVFVADGIDRAEYAANVALIAHKAKRGGLLAAWRPAVVA